MLSRISKTLSGASRPLLSDAIALLNMGRRSARADIASAGWQVFVACDAFPRANSFDDDINSAQRAVDLALHAVDLGRQEFLHFLEFGN